MVSELVQPHQHRTPGRSRWRIVVGIGASAIALVVVAALAGTGSAPEPLGLEETWGTTQAAGLLKHTARFQEAGLLSNGDTVKALKLKTARLRTHGARTTMLDDLDALTDPDPDAPDQIDEAATGDLAYPSDLEVQPLSGTKYCYDTATNCAGEMMTTARGANYARPPPPPPPPVDVAAETAAASVVEDDSDPDEPTEVDTAATSEESTSIEMGDDSDPDAPTDADGMEAISAGAGCDQYEDTDEEAWLECQAEGERGAGVVDWST